MATAYQTRPAAELTHSFQCPAVCFLLAEFLCDVFRHLGEYYFTFNVNNDRLLVNAEMTENAALCKKDTESIIDSVCVGCSYVASVMNR